jgi:tRNA (uracil-5-)-methyltransferase
VEINKSLCDAAVENLKFNSINNVSVLACDSCKFANRILGKTRYIHYLKNEENDSQTFDKSKRGRNSYTEEYQFSAVLVDPPRCGLDNKTTRAIQQYDHIIYISCNPTRLLENMIQVCVESI